MGAQIALGFAAIAMIVLGASQEESTRRWSDDTGEYSIEAEFVRMQDGEAVLRRTDGTIVAVPLRRLSSGDQDYLKQLVARRNGEQQAAPDQPNEGQDQTSSVGRHTIEAALDQRQDYTIRQTPLREAFGKLLQPAGIPYYVHWPALADELGVRGEEPVDFAAKGIAVRDAVNKLLGSLDMGWLIRDEVLYITGPVDSEMPDNSEVIVYRVRSSRVRADSLAKGIQSRVIPEAWNTAGGVGRAAVLGDRVVVIFQRTRLHHEILRRYGETLEPVYAAKRKVFERSPGEALSPRQIIPQVTKCDFQNVPFKEAVAEWQTVHGLKLEFDKASLDNWGVSADSRITLQLEGVRLESALNLLTKQVDLGWYVDGEHVVITHRVDAHEKLSDIVYEVGGLVQAAGKDSLPSIAAAIRTTVRTPLGRQAIGRPDPVQATGVGKLQVRACFADHRRIARLLEDLRAAYELTATEDNR